MQIFNAAVLLAAVATAAPQSAAREPFGIRYTDHKCQKLHSLPNRDFKESDCIDPLTVGSIRLPYFKTQCHLYVTRECKGDWQSGTETISANECVNLNTEMWRGIRSFRCVPHHD